MSNYDNDKQVILSKVTSDHPKAPPLRVQVEFDGKKYTGGLWPWQKKDGTPVQDKHGNQKYIGTLEVDTWEPNGQRPKPTEAEAFDDDIPF